MLSGPSDANIHLRTSLLLIAYYGYGLIKSEILQYTRLRTPTGESFHADLLQQ